jgi:hypothetical protein
MKKQLLILLVFLPIFGVAQISNICTNTIQSNNFEYGYQVNGGNFIAIDIRVDAEEDFELTSFKANLFLSSGAVLNNIKVTYYSEYLSQPGNIIGSEVVMPSSFVYQGTNFGLESYEVDLDITPYMFYGSANNDSTFWISLSNANVSLGYVYWETNTQSVIYSKAKGRTSSSSWQTISNSDCIYEISGNCITSIVPGCIDVTAFNYDSIATIDDGSCCYLMGCTNVSAVNYDSLACYDNGTCIISGCTDTMAYNYNSNAAISDSSCCYLSGCIDPSAVNYNATVCFDDGNCCYTSITAQLGAAINGEISNDLSGSAVALSANGLMAAIGSPGNSSNGTLSGHVRIFSYNGSTWSQVGNSIEGESSGDNSGSYLSLNDLGNIVAISAPWNDDHGNASGHVRIYNFDGSAWVQLGNDIDGVSSLDNFGRSVSLSSDGLTVAIGANGNDGNGNYAGHIRVFNYDGNSWLQLGNDIEGEVASDACGYAVSISSDGNTLAAGSPYNDGNGMQSGHVRIFNFDGVNWLQLGGNIEGESINDISGKSVSISDDGLTVAIGSPKNDDNGSDAGHVRVFKFNGASWIQVGLSINGESQYDNSGESISLSGDGDIIIIGSYQNDGNGIDAGHARVYKFNGSDWVQIGSDIDGQSAYDKAGWSVSISSNGEYYIVGALYNNDNGASAGHARVYSIQALCTSGCTDPVALNYDSLALVNDSSCCYISGCTDILGFNFDSLACIDDGSCILLGCLDSLAFNYNVLANTNDSSCCYISGCTISTATNYDSLACFNDGTCIVYGCIDSSAANYNYQATVTDSSCCFLSSFHVQVGSDIDGEAANDYSGSSVSLSADGTILAVGAQQNDGNGSNSGHVRVFENNGNNWTQLGNDIDGEFAEDLSGCEVSLSDDGLLLAIGAIRNDGSAYNAGHVRIYNYNGTNWIQLGADINGESSSDNSGESVSLSGDGSTVAIGAFANDGNGNNSGHVRVYQFNSNSWSQMGIDIDGESANDFSGFSVSLNTNGTILAVGAYGNDGSAADAGHVRVYSFNGNNWIQLGADIEGEAANDMGGTVAISGDGTIVAIGSAFNDENGANSGNVRVYEYAANSWNQLGFDIDGEATNDRFGHSIAISIDGAIIAVGADFNSGNGSEAGHVRVFKYNGSIWEQVGNDLQGEAAGDRFGFSVAISHDGDEVAVGGFKNDGNGSISGHTRVFSLTTSCAAGCTDPISFNYDSIAILDDSSCCYIAGCTNIFAVNYDSLACYDNGSCIVYGCMDTLAANYNNLATISDSSCCYISGCTDSVAVNYNALACYNDGSCIVLGCTDTLALNYNSVATLDDGSCCQTSWNQLGVKIIGEAAEDRFGNSISFNDDGTILAIGGHYNDGNGIKSGHVRIYSFNGSNWIQMGNDIDGEAIDDNSGSAIDLTPDGLTIVIGARGNNGVNGSISGHARVYHYDGTSWVQVGNDIDGQPLDFSGSAVSISSDGSIVGVGGDYNSTNGSYSGVVRIYKLISSTWIQLGNDINGESSYDRSGSRISMSSDGYTIAIGAFQNDGNGSNSGHVRVYNYDGNSWNQVGVDIDGEAAGDNSGVSVSLSADGNIIAIGALFNDGAGINAGHARVFSFDGVSWVQLGSDIEGVEDNGFFGYSISLNHAGTIVAVGSNMNDGNAIDAGSISVFKYNGNDWLQLEGAIYGEFAGDKFGVSITLSANGLKVASGATYNDDNGNMSGHVRVYELVTPCAGCLDPIAFNFDSTAIVSDSSCVYLGCTDSIAINFNPTATLNDSSCIYSGCIDSLAFNFNPIATIDDSSCIYSGCIDSLANNYNPNASIDDSSCVYICLEDFPSGVIVTDITHDRATINWNNMNTIACFVDQYRIKYREIGTTVWNQKTMGAPVGSCTFSCQKTNKLILSLTASTTYEYKIKAWYCGGGISAWSALQNFTTADECENVINFAVSTPTTTKVEFTWDSTSAYSFARIKLRVDTTAGVWTSAGGFGVIYPALTKNKNGLIAGTSYRAQARTWCDPTGGAYSSAAWTPLVFWTQPITIKLAGESLIANLTIYPNPSRDMFNISFTSEDVHDLKLRILNVIGEELMNENLNQFVGEYTKQIDLTNNAKGIYFLEIETHDGVINKKLILQ